jgi:hypothetical protein
MSAIVLAAICLVLLHTSGSANAPPPPRQPTTLFPADLGRFHLVDATQMPFDKERSKREADGPRLIAYGNYNLPDGSRVSSLRVYLAQWENDSAAYAALTNSRSALEKNVPVTSDIGTATLLTDRSVRFVRGSTSVDISFDQKNEDQLSSWHVSWPQRWMRERPKYPCW